jgi:hypothetical protein
MVQMVQPMAMTAETAMVVMAETVANNVIP